MALSTCSRVVFTDAPHLHPIYLNVIGDRIAPRSRPNKGYEVFNRDGRQLGVLVKYKPHHPVAEASFEA
jgi:hypothetical protein